MLTCECTEKAGQHSWVLCACAVWMHRLLSAGVHNLPPLTKLSSRWEQPLEKEQAKPVKCAFINPSLRLRVWRSNDQSRRERTQLERGGWGIMVKKPSNGLRNHVPSGCSTASGHECLFWWLWSRGMWWSMSLIPWERKSLCPCSQGVSISTWLHFLGRSVMLMDILHREWVQQSQARGRTPCSSTFRLKQTFGQEWTSKLTHWFLLLFPRVQTFVGFSTLAVFFFLLPEGLSSFLGKTHFYFCFSILLQNLIKHIIFTMSTPMALKSKIFSQFKFVIPCGRQ